MKIHEKKNIEQIAREYSRNRYLRGRISNPAYSNEGGNLWSFHILPVAHHAKYLCDVYSVDHTPVLLAAYFHDITRLDGDDKNHHVSSADFAKRFLLENQVDSKVIEIVFNAIHEHRGSFNLPKSGIESEILASADGFALISNIHLLFFSAFRKHNLSVDTGTTKVLSKIDKSLRKLLPESKTEIDNLLGKFLDHLRRYK